MSFCLCVGLGFWWGGIVLGAEELFVVMEQSILVHEGLRYISRGAPGG